MKCLICHGEIIPDVTWVTFWRLPDKKQCCRSCSRAFRIIENPGCLKCGRPDGDGICPDCRQWQVTNPGLLEWNRSVFSYEEAAKDFVARWKYRGDYALLEALIPEVQRIFKREQLGEVSFLAVPLSIEREKERGFNQSEAIIHHLGLKPIHAFKRVHSGKQAKKGRQGRLRGINPFSLVTEVDGPCVIVDDIYTTGRTIRHMAALLKQSGCPAVYSFTLFR